MQACGSYLKKKGLEWMMSQLSKFIASALMIANEAITVQYMGMEEVTHSIEVVSLTVSRSCLVCMHMCNIIKYSA